MVNYQNWNLITINFVITLRKDIYLDSMAVGSVVSLLIFFYLFCPDGPKFKHQLTFAKVQQQPKNWEINIFRIVYHNLIAGNLLHLNTYLKLRPDSCWKQYLKLRPSQLLETICSKLRPSHSYWRQYGVLANFLLVWSSLRTFFIITSKEELPTFNILQRRKNFLLRRCQVLYSTSLSVSQGGTEMFREVGEWDICRRGGEWDIFRRGGEWDIFRRGGEWDIFRRGGEWYICRRGGEWDIFRRGGKWAKNIHIPL